MSGFKVLIHLIPRVRQPEIAVIMLTRVALPSMREVALKNDARAYLVKLQTSGDVFNHVIHEAIARVPRRESSFGECH